MSECVCVFVFLIGGKPSGLCIVLLDGTEAEADTEADVFVLCCCVWYFDPYTYRTLVYIIIMYVWVCIAQL